MDGARHGRHSRAARAASARSARSRRYPRCQRLAALGARVSVPEERLIVRTCLFCGHEVGVSGGRGLRPRRGAGAGRTRGYLYPFSPTFDSTPARSARIGLNGAGFKRDWVTFARQGGGSGIAADDQYVYFITGG